MSFKTFDQDIKMGLKKTYLFFGHEKYLIEQYLDKMIEKYVDPGYKDFNLIIVDGEKSTLDEILDTCETMPFFSESKIVIVKNIQYFRSKKNNLSKAEEQRLLDYFDNPSETTNLFMISNTPVDLRKKITKSVKKVGGLIEFSRLDSSIFSKWMHKKINNLDKIINGNELRHLVDRMAYLDKNTSKNLLDVDNEIQMICSSLGERKEISIEDIDKYVKKPLAANIFDLVDAVGQKKVDKALKTMNKLLNDGEPIQIIFSMICRQFRLLKKIKMLASEGYNQSSIAKLIGVHPYSVKTIMRQISAFDEKTLSLILEKCSDLDYKSKSTSIDFRLGVETLIVECSLFMK